MMELQRVINKENSNQVQRKQCNNNQSKQQTNLPRYPKIMLRQNNSKLILPFLFVIEASIRRSKARDCPSFAQEGKMVRLQGVLTYENGLPVSFKQNMFITLPYMKRLSKFFFFCRKSYEIKFIFDHKISSQFQFNNDNDIRQYALQKDPQIFRQLTTKFQQNKESLITFLTKVGLISCKQKSINRYRSILLAQIAKTKMLDILGSHYDIMSNQEKQRAQMKIGTIQQKNSSSTKKHDSLRRNTCCQQEHKYSKQDYPKVQFWNSSVRQVLNIQFQESNCSRFSDQGGYFTVEEYLADVWLNNHEQPTQQLKIQKQQQDKALIQKENCIYEPISSNQEQSPLDQICQLSKDNDENLAKRQCQQSTYKPRIQLAVKQLRSDHENNNKYLNKVEYEKNIIKNIRRSPYICQYYNIKQKNTIPPTLKFNASNSIIMQNLCMSLKQVLQNRLVCDQFQVCKELTKAVIQVHRNGIIHRDIKPGNIMFNFQGQLKIIDFSQSIQCWNKFSVQNFKDLNIGFTLPYSPLQCSYICEQGYSNFKIDNWSVGITICEIILGNLPVCYSKSLAQTIKKGWQTQQFHWCMNLRRGSLNKEILLPIKILCMKLMQANSRKRLCLNSFLKLLKFYQDHFFK